jgi:NADH-quinone oxidoreductase subunit F
MSIVTPDPPDTDNAADAPIDLAEVDAIVARLGTEKHHVIHILHEIQEHYRYLPLAALRRVCEITQISPAQIEGVSTFFKQYRHVPVGRNIVKVCVGTACHVAGADNIHESFCEAVGVTPEEAAAAGDLVNDKDGSFTFEKVACIGCCALAPVVQSERDTYGPLEQTDATQVLRQIEERRELPPSAIETADADATEAVGELRIALDSCCIAKGADKVFNELKSLVAELELPVRVKPVGCVGMSCNSPVIDVVRDGTEEARYGPVAPHEVRKLVLRHFAPGNPLRRLSQLVMRGVEDILDNKNWRPIESRLLRERSENSAAFFGPQVRIVTEHCGMIDPLDLADYRAHGGFDALEKALTTMSQTQVIDTLTQSGLRGRGGAGFLTGKKWGFVAGADGDEKYVIVNGDEGDPGAFMDRMVLESYPFRVIEGVAIAAYAVGSRNVLFYIRAEYPLAIKRVEAAIAVCRQAGLIGDGVMGTDFSVDMTIMKGAGAFICGEETAMINSIEGERGTPRTRPPYPATHGLWGRPTLINNVETLASVSWIVRNGAPAYNQHGTKTSKGTKVFALAGKVQRGGLIEVPLGITINEIVHEIGGGVGEGRKFKAIQIGGPSGGCIPESLCDTPIDYEALRSLGAIMGSGGMVVLDDTDCMVDIARYFMSFTKEESCGQCSIGRLGTTRLLEILDRICAGEGREADLAELEDLGDVVLRGSLCALCGTAPNPVLTTLKYFRHEYEAHLQGRCPAGKCKDLINYVIKDNCIGCTICSQY